MDASHGQLRSHSANSFGGTKHNSRVTKQTGQEEEKSRTRRRGGREGRQEEEVGGSMQQSGGHQRHQPGGGAHECRHGHSHGHGHGHGHRHGHGSRAAFQKQFPWLHSFFRRWGGFICVSFIWFFCSLSYVPTGPCSFFVCTCRAMGVFRQRSFTVDACSRPSSLDRFISIWHYVFLPLEMWASGGKLVLLVGFHCLVAACLSTYARISLSDPGYVDPNWVRSAIRAMHARKFKLTCS